MTLTSTTTTISHIGNGSVTVFAYNFRVDESDHMEVYLDGVLQTTGYTVDGLGNPSGGNVTFDTAPAADVLVVLLRIVPYTQEVDYQPYDPFPAETHENALDLLTMQTQQLKENIDRAIAAPPGSDPTVDYTLPLYDAGKGIIWSESAKELVNSDDNINGIVADATAAKVAAEAAQAAAEAAQTGAEAAEVNAETSETNAATSETNAAASEDMAEEWAENPEDDEITGHPGSYSALHWAAKSQDVFDDGLDTNNEWTKAQTYEHHTYNNVSGTQTLDLSYMNSCSFLINGATTFAVSNMAAGRGCELKIIQDATGGRTVGWSTDLDIAAYDAAVNEDASAVTIYWIWSDGSKCYVRKLWEDD